MSINMKRHITLVSLLTITVMVVGLTIGWAQVDLGQSAARARAGMTNLLGTRATGMGGASVAAPEPGAALYWNPAALARERGFRLSGSLGGSAEGLSAAEDLRDVVDIIDDAQTAVDIGIEDFFTIRDIIIRNDGETIRGEAGLLGGLQYNNFALGYWVMAGGDAGVNHTQIGSTDERVDWDATAAGQASAGVGYGHSLSEQLAVGVTVRQLWVGSGFSVGSAEARGIDEEARILVDAAYGEINDGAEYDDTITVDLGLLYSPDERVHYGLVGRNLTNPSFTGVPAFEDLDLSVDLGYAYTWDDGSIFAIDCHNVTEANGKNSSIAVGLGAMLGRDVQIRTGYGAGSPVLGLGLSMGSFDLDIASALRWEDRVAISGSIVF